MDKKHTTKSMFKAMRKVIVNRAKRAGKIAAISYFESYASNHNMEKNQIELAKEIIKSL